jgi:diguanylate cyclase (GGDEF)-like protein
MVVAEATERELRDLAEEIRLGIQRIRIPWGQKKIAITASLGAAYMKGDDPALRPSQLIERADHCLYEAKRSGRNRVVLNRATPSAEPDPHPQ